MLIPSHFIPGLSGILDEEVIEVRGVLLISSIECGVRDPAILGGLVQVWVYSFVPGSFVPRHSKEVGSDSRVSKVVCRVLI